MVSALTIMLYCTKWILKAAREGFSEKTRKLQMQLHKTLIAQRLQRNCSEKVSKSEKRALVDERRFSE
ncbi:hypothetical protein NECAME_17460 [Necator americanus]|uniref:Uncharacterized protein n=1 Tax=Necator americanus TaxID=51031 RepID=W2TP01_NECAM|nr:hypothetical protein NECAME_17460 [Necator americanus]ETN83409.1 hypothetical protein NECAME_17460 [Necator americanus]